MIFLLFRFMHFLCKVVISYMLSALLIFINFIKGYSSLQEFNPNKHSRYFFIPKLLDFSSIEKWSLLALLLGVLQQLVNCFLEASVESLTFRHILILTLSYLFLFLHSLTFRHILVISTKIRQDLKGSLEERL